MMDDGNKDLHCQLCGRVRRLTFHHFIPRFCHTNKWFQKRYDRQQMQEGIDLCRDCHKFIHKQFDEKQLGRDYNTREKLLADEKVARFVQWVRKQK